MDHKRCTYRIMWSDEDQEFVGLGTEIPSLCWLHPTMEGALKGIVDLLGPRRLPPVSVINMIIHCSQKLAAKLPDVSPTPLEEASPLGSWHGHVFTLDRRQCVMFCH